MASLDDINSTIKGAVTNLASLINASERQAFTVGNISAVNNLSTALVQVIAADNSANPRIWIVFHNPSNTVELLVCQSTFTATTFSNRGGGFLMLPGDYLTLVGNVAGAWSAIAQSGSANPLTIITSSS